MWHEGFSEWTRGTLGLHNHCGYNASRDHVVDTDFTKATATGTTRPPMSLALRGIRLSTIASLNPYPCYQAPLVASKSMHEAYVRLFDPPGTIGTWNSLRTKVSVGELVDMDFNLSRRGESGTHYMSHWGVAPPSWGNDTDGSKPIWLPCHGNCMFTDGEGRMGLCPSGSRVDDIVIVLYGGNVPCLLRPAAKLPNQGSNSDDEYYVVGECYAEGFMDGEACALLGDSRSEEVFVLI